MWRYRLRAESRVKQFANRPNVIRKPLRHCWRAFQCLMNAGKVVVHDVERHGSAVIIEFL